MSIIKMAVQIFLIMNVTGHLPAIVALVKDYAPARQRKILMREVFFAFCLASFYLFVGDWFLQSLHIARYTMSIAGGSVLLLVALEMIFPHHEHEAEGIPKGEPCIVPIAIPMLSGGGIFTTVVYLGSQTQNLLAVWIAIGISVLITGIILFFAPMMQRLVGKRGLMALEQLMGMVVVMMAIEMFVQGGGALVASLNQ